MRIVTVPGTHSQVTVKGRPLTQSCWNRRSRFCRTSRHDSQMNMEQDHSLSKRPALDVVVIGGETKLATSIIQRFRSTTHTSLPIRSVRFVYPDDDVIVSDGESYPKLDDDAVEQIDVDMTHVGDPDRTLESLRDIILRTKAGTVVYCTRDASLSSLDSEQALDSDETDSNTSDVLRQFDDLQVMKTIVNTCVDMAVNKLIFVSMLGAGDSEDSIPFQVMSTLRPHLLQLSNAEDYIRKTHHLNWTIIRPAPFDDDLDHHSPLGEHDNRDDDEGKDIVITEDVNVYGTVSTEECARAVVDVVNSDKVSSKTLHIVNGRRILITAPYVRPLEPWEARPFTPAQL